MNQPAQTRMDQVINIESNKNIVEIVVHVTEELNGNRRGDLVSTLKNTTGITNAEFCPLHYHLMLVRYNRNVYSSQDVLHNITRQNVDARLIGPV